jgi:hypothetical protein
MKEGLEAFAERAEAIEKNGWDKKKVKPIGANIADLFLPGQETRFVRALENAHFRPHGSETKLCGYCWHPMRGETVGPIDSLQRYGKHQGVAVRLMLAARWTNQ